jgi:hypothetical protein
MKVIDDLVVAYNNGNARAFADLFDVDAITYEHPNIVAQQTREGIYEYYKAVFAKFPNLKTQVLYRVEIGNRVIDHELVQRSPESEPFNVIAVYEIENDLITRLDLVRDNRTVVQTKTEN